MMDLWTELQRVRKQLAEHKEQTEHDLENQKNEFIRVLRNVGGLTRQLNLSGVEVSLHLFSSFFFFFSNKISKMNYKS